MPTLYEELSKSVSPIYHKRLKEIVMVLDPNVNYTVKCTKSITALKDFLWSAMKDNNNSGFVYVSDFMTPLNGKFTQYPTIKVSGDFVVIHVKHRVMNPQTGQVKTNNYIYVYEKGRDISTVLGRI